MTVYDDLGAEVPLRGPARRVVSLVPSLTETLAPLGVVVGATDWCTHPADLDARGVRRVRGTKNPDRGAIVDLAPDLVVANKEENRELDVRRLREAGVAVWVTDIGSVPQALTSIRRLVSEALELPVPGWVAGAERSWGRRDSALAGLRVAVPIWRDPWMAVGGDSFTSDVLRRLGAINAFESAARYPTVTLADLDSPDLDLVLLPDEPYLFTADDGPECFTQVPTRLVSGRLLTWYGPSLLEARDTLAEQAVPPEPGAG